MSLSQRHCRTLCAIFEQPTRADIRWADFLALCRALGAQLPKAGKTAGSRVNEEILTPVLDWLDLAGVAVVEQPDLAKHITGGQGAQQAAQQDQARANPRQVAQ